VGYTDTHGQQRDLISLLYFSQNNESRLKNPSHKCVCVCLYVYSPIVARQRLGINPLIVHRQRLGRNVTAVTKTHAKKKRIVGRVVLIVARVVSRKVGDYFFPELLV
jgi:hypothetical protein